MFMANIKETSEALNFGFDILDLYTEVFSDKKIQIDDLSPVLELIMGAPQAINGAENIIKELMDLDDAERMQLKQLIADRFNISYDEAEPHYEQIMFDVLSLTASITNLFKLKNKITDESS